MQDIYKNRTSQQHSMMFRKFNKSLLAITLSSFLFGSYASAVANTTANTTQGHQHADGVAIIVNESAILKSELHNKMIQLAAQYKQNGQPALTESQLRSSALDALITRQLQVDYIKRTGITPNAQVVNNELQKIAQGQGLNSLMELQQSMDARQPGSYAQLRQQIQESIAIQGLQQKQLSNKINISEQDINSFLNSPEGKTLNQKQYQTIHIRVPYPDDFDSLSSTQKTQANTTAAKVKSLLETTDAVSNEEVVVALQNIQSEYPIGLQGGNMGYHSASELPVHVKDDIQNLTIGGVTGLKKTPQGIDVIKLVDVRNSNQATIPQWHTRHILVQVNDIQNNELAEQKINDIYEQLRNGADFTNLASTYSDDTGSAGRGGDLNWVSEGEMVSEFEAMMKRTPVQDFSTPFQTQFGWHILQVVETRQKNVTDEKQRAAAKEVLYNRMAPQVIEDWLQELKSSAYIKILD